MYATTQTFNAPANAGWFPPVVIALAVIGGVVSTVWASIVVFSLLMNIMLALNPVVVGVAILAVLGLWFGFLGVLAFTSGRR